eukprot:GHVS01073638.1.p1 GENE.GHVS01073638.1~~GHVS01073638.1.p1  ORF type:complete len:629 (-),score=129.48 GHVS01073638.1:468-2207(-)
MSSSSPPPSPTSSSLSEGADISDGKSEQQQQPDEDEDEEFLYGRREEEGGETGDGNNNDEDLLSEADYLPNRHGTADMSASTHDVSTSAADHVLIELRRDAETRSSVEGMLAAAVIALKQPVTRHDHTNSGRANSSSGNTAGVGGTGVGSFRGGRGGRGRGGLSILDQFVLSAKLSGVRVNDMGNVSVGRGVGGGGWRSCLGQQQRGGRDSVGISGGRRSSVNSCYNTTSSGSTAAGVDVVAVCEGKWLSALKDIRTLLSRENGEAGMEYDGHLVEQHPMFAHFYLLRHRVLSRDIAQVYRALMVGLHLPLLQEILRVLLLLVTPPSRGWYEHWLGGSRSSLDDSKKTNNKEQGEDITNSRRAHQDAISNNMKMAALEETEATVELQHRRDMASKMNKCMQLLKIDFGDRDLWTFLSRNAVDLADSHRFGCIDAVEFEMYEQKVAERQQLLEEEKQLKDKEERGEEEEEDVVRPGRRCSNTKAPKPMTSERLRDKIYNITRETRKMENTIRDAKDKVVAVEWSMEDLARRAMCLLPAGRPQMQLMRALLGEKEVSACVIVCVYLCCCYSLFLVDYSTTL